MKIIPQDLVLLNYDLNPEYPDIPSAKISVKSTLSYDYKLINGKYGIMLWWTVDYFIKEPAQSVMSYKGITEFEFENDDADDLPVLQKYLNEYYSKIYSFVQTYTPVNVPYPEHLFSPKTDEYYQDTADNLLTFIRRCPVYEIRVLRPGEEIRSVVVKKVIR